MRAMSLAGGVPLATLGWSPFFERQLKPDELHAALPGRITRIERSGISVATALREQQVSLGGRWFRGAAEHRPTVGDWVLVRAERIVRVLGRKSLLQRLAPGSNGTVQLMGANVDTLFVVSACDVDFNLSRLERYLGLARQAGVRPVLILTKCDLVPEPGRFVERAAGLEPGLPVYGVNALDPNTLDAVLRWCGPGQTVAMAGSSGVGKSTLLNTLCAADIQATGPVRAGRKGRHTTTRRSLHSLPSGGLLLDSPGTRELHLVGTNAAGSFEDVERLARHCRFANCAHIAEPGCAVRQAVQRGDLTERRLANYLKLKREQAVRPSI